MNNFTISTFDDFEEIIEDEPVSIEFGMDPVIKIIESSIFRFKLLLNSFLHYVYIF